jgi:predicted HTH domain antitoxin
MSAKITLQIPIESIEQGDKAILQEIALQLYQQRAITFARTRRMLGLTVWELQKLLGENRIDRHYDEKDLEEDIETISSENW